METLGLQRLLLESIEGTAANLGAAGRLAYTDDTGVAKSRDELRKSIDSYRLRLEPLSREGHVFAAQTSQTFEFVAFAIACHMCAIPLFLISPDATENEISQAIDVSRATRVYSNSAFLAGTQTGDTIRSFRKTSQKPKRPKNGPPDNGRTALGVLTSGTSGRPKAVRFTQQQVAFILSSLQARLQYASDDVIYCALPLSFDYGYYQILLSVTSTARLHLDRTKAIGLTVRKLRICGATVLPAVPTLLTKYILEAKRHGAADRLRLITNTGEPLPVPIQQQLNTLQPELTVALMYGLTECKRVSIGIYKAHQLPRIDVGYPIDGTSVEILGSDGRPTSVGTPGEVVVRGPHIGRTDENELSSGNYQLRTGDIGWMDAEGCLNISGRMNDLEIKINGMRVERKEIEDAARGCEGVLDARCGYDGAEYGAAALWVVGKATAREVIEHLRRLLNANKIPSRIYTVPALPENRNGKFDPTGELHG